MTSDLSSSSLKSSLALLLSSLPCSDVLCLTYWVRVRKASWTSHSVNPCSLTPSKSGILLKCVYRQVHDTYKSYFFSEGSQNMNFCQTFNIQTVPIVTLNYNFWIAMIKVQNYVFIWIKILICLEHQSSPQPHWRPRCRTLKASSIVMELFLLLININPVKHNNITRYQLN